MTLRLESSGERLDAALARLVPELSRSQAQRLLAQGLVTANGKPLKKNEKSTAGMVLELTLPEAQETDLPAQEIPLDIRYEDSDVIVINKPKGCRPPRAGAPGRDGGQRAAASLRRFSFRYRRGKAPRHCPPD